MNKDVEKLIVHIRRTLTDLSAPWSGTEYEYASLPLCVIDAVFSLGVRYESTQRTVHEWCLKYRWEESRTKASSEHTTNDFLKILEAYGNRWEDIASEVFNNRQRTSSRSGILKAEAVYKFSKTLQLFGIQTFADILNLKSHDALGEAIKSIPGQASGLSFHYFLILTGYPNAVKADRMVRRFVANALGVHDVALEQAKDLVIAASKSLQSEFHNLTPSLLDNKIWKYQRDQDITAPANCRH